MYSIILKFCFLPTVIVGGLHCINSTSYKDRVLIAPKSLVCISEHALCVKTMQISTTTEGLPEVLSIHRECYELEPLSTTNGCNDSYEQNPRRTVVFLNQSQAAKILVYSPRMMESHVAYMANIANCLAENGHEVTVIDNISRNDIGNFLGPNINQTLAVEPSSDVTKILNQGNLPELLWKSRPEPKDQRKLMEGIGHLHRIQCLHVIQNSNLVELLQQSHFDVAINEVFDTCGIGLIELANVKKSIIVSSTLPMDVVPWALGISSLIHDGSLLSDYGSRIGIFDKMRNMKFISAMLNFFELQAVDVEKAFRQKYGLKTSFYTSMRKANLLYNNINEKSDIIRSTSRRTLDIAGISFKESQQLTDEYTEILLDSRKIVLISFGTAATSAHMPTELKSSILQAIKSLPEYLFIWKYELEDDFVKSATANVSNVIFRKYLPQSSILNSGNVSLFITHCGKNSLLETFQSGTRALAVPLFGDQHQNAKASEEANLLEILPKIYLQDSSKIIAAIRKSMQPNQLITDALNRVSIDLKNARNRSRNLVISSVEALIEDQFPMDFSKFPHSYHPDTVLLFCNTILFSLPLLVFSLIFFARK